MAKEPMKDIVVIVPGILGSALEKDGKTVWDMSAGAALRAIISLGKSVKELKLDGDDPDADELGDGVRPTRVLPDLHLIPGLWKIDGYGAITKRLQRQFDLIEGENYFEFPYDWRRHNIVAGRRLRRESHAWLQTWRQKTNNPDAKLILLAHSMGGLVSRAFLELEEGWRDTRTLVTFGTPFRGALNAANFIGNGFKQKVGPITVADLTELLRSLSSVYELLPTYPCIDDGTGTLQRPAEATGFPHLDPSRARAALDFHAAIADSVHDKRNDTEYADHGYRLEPIVGTDQPTSNSGRIDGGRVVMSSSIDGMRILGDGTVPRPSAYPQEVDDPTDGVFSSQPHARIQNQEAILDHVAGLFTASGFDLGAFRGPPIRIGIVTDDLWVADQGAEVCVETSDPSAPISITVTDAESGDIVAEVAATGTGERRTVEVPGVGEGAYRVTAATGSTSVTDVVLAAADQSS